MRRTVLILLLLPVVGALAQAAPATPPTSAAPAVKPAATGVVKLPTAPLVLPKSITPDQAVAYAIQNSTDLAIARQGVATAEGYLTQARAMNSLTLNLSGSYVKTGPPTSFTLPASGSTPAQSFSLAPNSMYIATLSASLPLYLGSRDRYARQAGAAGVAAAGMSIEAAKLQLATAVRQAAYTVLRYEQLAVVAQARVTALTEHLRVTNAMFAAGTAPRFEVVQAETDLDQAKGDAIHAQTAVDLILAEVATLLNAPQGLKVEIEEGEAHELPKGDMNKLTQAALEQRAEVKALQAQISAQEANLRLAQASQRPSVSLDGALNNETESVAAAGVNWSLSVGAKWPLYQGGLTRGKVQVAQAALTTARLNLDRTAQEIALEVTQALFKVQDAQETLKVAQQGETNARERARIAEVRFSNGVGLGVEVIDAQTALAAAAGQVINARYDLQSAVVSLRSALGFSDLPKEPLG